jgi:hypothetical protein
MHLGLTLTQVLTVEELYRRIESDKDSMHCEVVVSYLEVSAKREQWTSKGKDHCAHALRQVYNEKIRDLLQPGPDLAVREDAKGKTRAACMACMECLSIICVWGLPAVPSLFFDQAATIAAVFCPFHLQGESQERTASPLMRRRICQRAVDAPAQGRAGLCEHSFCARWFSPSHLQISNGDPSLTWCQGAAGHARGWQQQPHAAPD